MALPAQHLDGCVCGRRGLARREWGLEERSRNPSIPSARNRLTHLATVFGEVLNSSAAAAWVSPPPTARTVIGDAKVFLRRRAEN